jgi:hypothetical protein
MDSSQQLAYSKTQTMNHLNQNRHVFPPDINLAGAIHTPYSIGQLDRTLDIVIGENDRRIYWEASEDDNLVRPYSGWDELVKVDETGNEYLDVPTNARRASTILGGMEAWMGEKDEILSVITRYISRVAIDLKAVDVSLSLDTIGVERGNYHMFAAPPHQLETDARVIQDWAENLYNDAEQVLALDPRKEELLGSVRATLSTLADRELL